MFHRVGNVLKVTGVVNLCARIRLAADHRLKKEGDVHLEINRRRG